MIVEILTSTIAGAIVGSSYIYQQGIGGDDTKKIEKIAANCGLVSKDSKKIRIYKKRRKKEYSEYIFQMPFGLSLKQFQDKLDNFNDGLNIKTTMLDFNITDLKRIDFKKNPIPQLKELFNKRQRISKEVQIEYDGMLKFKIYNQPLINFYELLEDDINSCKQWQIPIGISRSSKVIHDFDKVAHMIVAGATDYGKSNFLELVTSILTKRKPDDVEFTLIDLKGGLSFQKYVGMQQVKSFAKTPEEALLSLNEAQILLNERFEMLLKNKAKDVKDMGYKKRHFVIIDEAADIADDKDCQDL